MLEAMLWTGRRHDLLQRQPLDSFVERRSNAVHTNQRANNKNTQSAPRVVRSTTTTDRVPVMLNGESLRERRSSAALACRLTRDGLPIFVAELEELFKDCRNRRCFL